MSGPLASVAAQNYAIRYFAQFFYQQSLCNIPYWFFPKNIVIYNCSKGEQKVRYKMAHHHSHCHHHHYHRRYRSSGTGGELITLAIVLIIVFIVMIFNSAKYNKYWNNGFHTCGRAYTYHICEECGEIDEIYCVPCNYKLNIPESIKLK